MTLARTTLFVICTNDLGRAGRNYRQPPRPNAASTFDIRRSRRLAAKWHVCPQTHRLECSWSFEAAPLTINYVVTQCKDVAGERLAAV